MFETPDLNLVCVDVRTSPLNLGGTPQDVPDQTHMCLGETDKNVSKYLHSYTVQHNKSPHTAYLLRLLRPRPCRLSALDRLPRGFLVTTPQRALVTMALPKISTPITEMFGIQHPIMLAGRRLTSHVATELMACSSSQSLVLLKDSPLVSGLLRTCEV